MLFNPLNWARSEVVTITLPQTTASDSVWRAATSDGESLITQLTKNPDTPNHLSLLVFVPDLPSVGYQLIWLMPTDQATCSPTIPDQWILENQILKASIDPSTGAISSLIHKPSGQETFSAPGNKLQAFIDKGQYWDAWNIAPDYQSHPLKDFQLRSIEWLEYGPLRQSIRVVQTLNQSTFIQDYILNHQSNTLNIHTQVDWHETQVLIKANFPLTVSAPSATYEIPFGAIQRSTTPKDSWEAAKWEVPALRWADLSQSDFGVSILTDYKHGFDALPSQLRLTLLKSPLWPDPKADRGQHNFRYSIYPHQLGWPTVKTVQLAYNANFPIQVCSHSQTPTDQPERQPNQTKVNNLPPAASFLDLGENTIVMSAFKKAESTTDQFILRCYESTGAKSTIQFISPLSIELSEALNILEKPYLSHHCSTASSPGPNSPDVAIRPWQIASFAIQLQKISNE